MSGIVMRYKATKTDKFVVGLIASISVSYVSVLAGLPLAIALVMGAASIVYFLCSFLKPSNRCGICDHEFNTSSPAKNVGEADSNSKTSKWICTGCHRIALTSGQVPK